MRYRCDGAPSATQYSNGCRCADCREAWRLSREEDRTKKRKSVRRDTPIVEHDAFTREQIMKARE